MTNLARKNDALKGAKLKWWDVDDRELRSPYGKPVTGKMKK